MSRSRTPVVSLKSVIRKYVSGAEVTRAVNGISLDIGCGEFVALYGASGSGKTTLINLMAGLDTADSGSVLGAGHDIGTMRSDARALMRREDIGVVFQDHNLIEEFTAIENVILPSVSGGKSRRAVEPLGRTILADVGLNGLEKRFPRQLSGGQRQRVGVARALLGNRQVLLADEPTGALDRKNSVSLFELLRAQAQSGVTVVVATHDPLARDYADTVIEIVDGRIDSIDVAA